MNLVIENIVFSLQKIGGISVVWFEHVKRVSQDKEIKTKFIEYRNAEQNILRALLNFNKSDLITDNSKFFFFKKFFNPKFRFKENYIFHSSNYRISLDRSAINVITIHDFLYFKNDWKGFYIWLARVVHKFQMSKAIKKADCLICISQATKNDLTRYFPEINEKKIKVVHNGVSDEYFVVNKTNLDIPFLPYEYCIFVGSRSSYKNFKVAVEAVSKSGKKLLIIGKNLNKSELDFIQNYLLPNQYKVLSNVSNMKLNVFYNFAYCLLYPSSFEGFGIPIVEAQKAGCPVVAQEISSIPEVIGKTPLLLKTISTETLIGAMKILENHEIRQQIIELGLENSRRFSWDKNYKEIKQIYKDIVNQN